MRDARVHPVDVGGAAAGPAVESSSRLGRGWEGPVLLLFTLLLLSFGLVMLYSASAVLAQARGLADYHYVVRQAVGGVLGVVALVVLARLDYRRLGRWSWPILGAVVLMLLVVVMPGFEGIAPEVNGARRWIVAGPVAIQPSELAKLALVVWTAALAVKKQALFSSLRRGLLPFLIIWTVVAGLIMLQPDLSSALIVLTLAALVVFAAGARIGHFMFLGLIALPVIWARISSMDYRLRRIRAYLNPSGDLTGIGYQVNQSLIALGSGGLIGRGVGEGQQKFGFLPEPHNDFVFAMIGEEWGFLGGAAIVLAFAAFGLVGYRVARHAPDLFGTLLAIGLTNLIVLQALLHIAVTMALVPATGTTLPFISYGRSSLLVCLASVGVLMSIARAGALPGGDA